MINNIKRNREVIISQNKATPVEPKKPNASLKNHPWQLSKQEKRNSVLIKEREREEWMMTKVCAGETATC